MSEKNEIVTKENQHIKYIDENLQLIQNQNQLSETDLKNFAIQCKRTGLDPITRQIYAIPISGKMTIMASIDGLRLIADRSGLYEGQTQPQWCGQDGVWADVWLKKETPSACKIGVHKKNFKEPLYAIAIFNEYAKKTYGDLDFMWKKMPALMIAKVAESLALRKAFPNEMSGIYSTDEMDQATSTTAREVNTTAAIDGHNSEKKHITEKVADIQGAKSTDQIDFNSYVIKFGKKMAGKKLSDFSIEDHRSMVTWLSDQAAEKGQPIRGAALEYQEYATAWIIAQAKNSPPQIDTNEKMPF